MMFPSFLSALSYIDITPSLLKSPCFYVTWKSQLHILVGANEIFGDKRRDHIEADEAGVSSEVCNMQQSFMCIWKQTDHSNQPVYDSSILDLCILYDFPTGHTFLWSKLHNFFLRVDKKKSE